ncbi:MAG TPA: PEGA domain-containing protein, partial [Candidatus Saccharimonadales bacterium]|nr:PEGA domain-containing protein [Candidatus Saccharimonadales bacterium]
GSDILLNGKTTARTNTRMSLPAGNYNMQIQRTDYRPWQRAITVQGNSVERFDYPFLFPNNLVTKNTKSLTTAPIDASQSPSRRWILLENGVGGAFTLVDVNNSKKIATKNITIPTGIMTIAETSAPQSLKVAEWSNDNRHVLLEHHYDKTYEYIMLDTQDLTKSQNLNVALGIQPPIQLSLQNKRYDHYFILDPTAKTLGTNSLSNATVTPMLKNVLAFKNYGNDRILYASNQNAPDGQASILLYQDKQKYFIRNVTKSSTYLLDLTTFSNSWYIVAGSPADNKVYVYKNPVEALSQTTQNVLVPVTVLKVTNPNYIKFSDSAQFIVAENGNSFAVYDVQYNNNFVYSVNAPLDKPQIHATWMDGDRLDYISGGKLVVFDYDDTNKQTLMASNPNYNAFFNPGYSFVYAISNAAKTGDAQPAMQLTNTALLAPRDQ